MATISERASSLARAAAEAAVSLVLPPVCLRCEGRRFGRTPLCLACLRRLDRLGPGACPRCGLPS